MYSHSSPHLPVLYKSMQCFPQNYPSISGSVIHYQMTYTFMSLQDAGGHDSPQLPSLCISRQCLSQHYTSNSLFCHRLWGNLFSSLICYAASRCKRSWFSTGSYSLLIFSLLLSVHLLVLISCYFSPSFSMPWECQILKALFSHCIY